MNSYFQATENSSVFLNEMQEEISTNDTMFQFF